MITIYSKDNCTYCEQAIQLCTQKGVDFEVKKLGADIDREGLIEKISSFGITPRTMPQIVEGGEYIGGFRELEQKLA